MPQIISKKKKRVHFLIPTLNIGGAEKYIATIAPEISKKGWEVSVGVLYSGGVFWDELKENKNISLINHNRKGKWDFYFLKSLIEYLKDEEVSVIQGCIPPANSFAVFAGKMAKTPAKLMGIMASDANYAGIGPKTYFKLDKYLGNWWADKIIVNSHTGIKHHSGKGFENLKMDYVPNPINWNIYSREISQDIITTFKKNLGVPYKNHVIGIIGRINPEKDHETFFKAAAWLAEKKENVTFLVHGDGDENLKKYYYDLVEKLGLKGKVIWSKRLDDLTLLYNSIDIVVSSSITEGTPNVLLEAMAAGRPIVATDAGDSSFLFNGGRSGVIVPIKSPILIGKACLNIIENSKSSINNAKKAKLYVKENYSIDKSVEKILQIYSDLL